MTQNFLGKGRQKGPLGGHYPRIPGKKERDRKGKRKKKRVSWLAIIRYQNRQIRARKTLLGIFTKIKFFRETKIGPNLVFGYKSDFYHGV